MQGRLAGLEEDVRNVRRGQEFTEERLGKVEGVCLNVLSNVFGESKADAMRYFRGTTGFRGKVDPGPPKLISTAVGTGPGIDKSDLLMATGPTPSDRSKAGEAIVSEDAEDTMEENGDSEGAEEGKRRGDSAGGQEGERRGDSVSPQEFEERGDSEGPQNGEMAHTPDFVPSINDGVYAFNNIDRSPVERATKPVP